MRTAWVILKFVAVFYVGMVLLALQCLVSRDARRRYLYRTHQLRSASVAGIERHILDQL